MRKTLTALLGSLAMLAFASPAFAEGGCSFGHSKQVMASAAETETASMSTFDGDLKSPVKTENADDAAIVQVPAEDEKTAE